MLVNCPICSEVLLPSDVLFSTNCGHIFHASCLNRWISNNTTCPQCRQECSSQSSIHRIYLPEVNFQDQDQLIERMNEINQKKIEYESKLKKIEREKKILENDLRKKKKEYHRVVQRTMNTKKKGTHIPPRHLKNATVNSVILGPESQAHSSKHPPSSSSLSPARQKSKRNPSRLLRSKLYFERKRAEHLANINNNNDNNRSSNNETVEIEDNIEVETIADSPAPISVSSETISSN